MTTSVAGRSRRGCIGQSYSRWRRLTPTKMRLLQQPPWGPSQSESTGCEHTLTAGNRCFKMLRWWKCRRSCKRASGSPPPQLPALVDRRRPLCLRPPSTLIDCATFRKRESSKKHRSLLRIDRPLAAIRQHKKAHEWASLLCRGPAVQAANCSGAPAHPPPSTFPAILSARRKKSLQEMNFYKRFLQIKISSKRRVFADDAEVSCTCASRTLTDETC
jgi:hypothetical protein